MRELARSAHAGHVDKLGRDYFDAHLEPIAVTLSVFGTEAEMAGYLHDILEDTSVSAEDLREFGLPENVLRAIESVSKRPGEPYIELISARRRIPSDDW